MKKEILCGVFLVFALWILGSCSSQKDLYYWEDYKDSSYRYFAKKRPEDANKLILTLTEMVRNAEKGSRKVPPPGTYAELGFLLIERGDRNAGLSYLKQEMFVYPESKVFVERILKQLQ